MVKGKTKGGFISWIKGAITPSLLVIGIVGGTIYFAELKGIVFSTPEMKIKTENFVNEPVNRVTIFRQGDTLKKQLRRTESLLDSIHKDNKKKFIKDSIKTIKVESSRSKRDSLMVEILEENKQVKAYQRNQNLMNELILKKLDSMNKH